MLLHVPRPWAACGKLCRGISLHAQEQVRDARQRASGWRHPLARPHRLCSFLVWPPLDASGGEAAAVHKLSASSSAVARARRCPTAAPRASCISAPRIGPGHAPRLPRLSFLPPAQASRAGSRAHFYRQSEGSRQPSYTASSSAPADGRNASLASPAIQEVWRCSWRLGAAPAARGRALPGMVRARRGAQ